MKIVLSLLAVLVFGACATHSHHPKTALLSGEVRSLEGDFMPSPDVQKDLSGLPLRARIAITPAVNAESTRFPFFDTLPVRPVKEVESNASGKFRLRLPPGRYSLFVKLEKGWYANLIQDGIIQPVYLQKDSTTNVIIKVTANATF